MDKSYNKCYESTNVVAQSNVEMAYYTCIQTITHTN